MNCDNTVEIRDKGEFVNEGGFWFFAISAYVFMLGRVWAFGPLAGWTFGYVYFEFT